MDRLPTGLKSLKSSPYLLYLLNYNDQQKPTKTLTDCEQYLCEMLFPQWEFLVCAEGDEYVYMILLPKTERDLFLLNTDLSSLLQDLIAHYSIHNTDKGLPIYDDCRSLMENLLDEVENLNGPEKRILPPRIEQAENHLYEQPTGKREICIITVWIRVLQGNILNDGVHAEIRSLRVISWGLMFRIRTIVTVVAVRTRHLQSRSAIHFLIIRLNPPRSQHQRRVIDESIPH